MILVTAFEPFDIDPENSSALATAHLIEKTVPSVERMILPVSFVRLKQSLAKIGEIEGLQAIVACGQADSRSVITVEQVALNWIDARIPDSDGDQPIDQVIAKDARGGSSLWGNLSARKIGRAVEKSGVPCEVSYHAGTYVCNYWYYLISAFALERKILSTFVHFPLLVGQKLGAGREGRRPFAELSRANAQKAVNEILKEVQALV